ncbi:MAG: relaxase domain-containing protein [Candidatus Didemnitutus sp.]|nr:relaxase domain-containing protein [Candidatus Didemnitutus sp.]
MLRFDRPCQLVRGAVGYFREHLKVGDYLSQGGETPMSWCGRGAERLGLVGDCRLEDFETLCRGQHPATGERLTLRDKGSRRRVCYFGQVSAPKDVSLLYFVGRDDRIADWWEEAVAETLHEMEALTRTRVRRDGAGDDRVTGEMVAAVVTHETSRALDPQLHTHVCILNVTFDAVEGRWKGVQPSGYYRHQAFLREVCYNRLASRMRAAGYGIESRPGIGFDVTGIPAELRERFSKRRRQIAAMAKRLGVESQDALQAIAADSRAEKRTLSRSQLQANWEAQAGEDLPKLAALISQSDQQANVTIPDTAPAALSSAEAHVFERCSVVDERVLLREALCAGRGTTSLEALRRELSARVSVGSLLHHHEEIASRDALAAEEEFVGWTRHTSRVSPIGSGQEFAGLAPEQAAAVRGILHSDRQVVVLQGDAGTGKTTALRTVLREAEAAGLRVFGCAPSAGATEVLRKELTADAHTLQRLLVDHSLQAEVRGRMLLVDEAGLISVREMRDLCRLARFNGCRLLLVGDVKQHHAVEAGDALRCLQKYADVPTFRLSEIRRQRDPAYRAAVGMLARGDARGAFAAFERLGAVKAMRSAPALFNAAANEYLRTIQSGETCLAISPVWSEIHSFTQCIRHRLQAAGLIGADERRVNSILPLKWTREQRRRVGNYRPGDVLTFHRNCGDFTRQESVRVVGVEGDKLIVQTAENTRQRFDPGRWSSFEVGTEKEIPLAKGDRLLLRANVAAHDLRNGDLVEIEAFERDGIIALRDGRKLPAWFRQFTHGYATTSHAAQGKTVDRGIVLLAEAGLAAANLKQAYVSNSRFRLSQRIFTTDRRAARAALARPDDRKLASELHEPAPPPLSLRERLHHRHLASA